MPNWVLFFFFLLSTCCVEIFSQTFPLNSYAVVYNSPAVNIRLNRTFSNNMYNLDPEQLTQLLLHECVQIVEQSVDEFVKIQTVKTQYKHYLNTTSNLMQLQGYLGNIETKYLKTVAHCPNYTAVTKDNTWSLIYSRICSQQGGCFVQDILQTVSPGTLFEVCEKQDMPGWTCVKLYTSEGATGYILSSSLHFFISNKLEDSNFLVKTNSQPTSLIPTIYIKDSVENRNKVIEQAYALLGSNTYCWGCLAMKKLISDSVTQNLNVLTGYDCSGLVSLSFRSSIFGFHQIPRDSHDQYLYSLNISSLQPGDLLFFAKPESKRVYHVMLYLGDDMLMESTSSSNSSRVVSLAERFDVPNLKEADLHFGELYNSHGLLFWGTMFAKPVNDIMSGTLIVMLIIVACFVCGFLVIMILIPITLSIFLLLRPNSNVLLQKIKTNKKYSAL